MGFKETFDGVKRFEKLLEVLIRHESLFFIKKELSIWSKTKKTTKPQVIREILEEMGGGFVKLGQLLSIRPDLIPLDYCVELSKLQDSVKPFPFIEAKKIIEKSTGKKINQTFSKFDARPIASASIGQVYRAKLKSGELVAVKVKRPRIEKLFEQDINLMENLASTAKRIHGVDIIDPEEIVLAFKEYTAKELDYEEEAKTLEVFNKNFEGSGIKVPKPFVSLSSKDVLIMEFVEGHELKDLMGKPGFEEYKKKISKIIFNSFLKQVMIDGAFHADPHPSNILIMPGKESRVALLDFGITGVLTPLMRTEIVKLFVALNEKDMEGVISAMMHMNMVSADNQEVRKDFKDMLGPYYGQGLKKIDISKLFTQSIKVARKHKVRVPKDYVLLGKAVITVESVCQSLYPEFNFVEESKPFITRLMIHEFAPSKFIARNVLRMENARKLAFEIPGIVLKMFSKNEEQDKRVEELSEHLLRTEHKIDVLIEKLILMFATLILIVGGLLLIKKGPVFDGISIFSIIAFCMAAATFLLALMLKTKKD
ncbi:MAG: ABC1 kinase family protein [Candidatus Nanoarchaeia archaeon]